METWRMMRKSGTYVARARTTESSFWLGGVSRYSGGRLWQQWTRKASIIDFHKRLVELLRSSTKDLMICHRRGRRKSSRPAGCWVYWVDLGEEEFRRWLVDSFLLTELCKTEVRGEFPMLRVVSLLD